MGKTSVNTACRPTFLRLEGDTSSCKNSRYELVCNSIKFGGAMISLILPKLIRSVARDGIVSSKGWPGHRTRPLWFLDALKRAPRTRRGTRPNLWTQFCKKRLVSHNVLFAWARRWRVNPGGGNRSAAPGNAPLFDLHF